MGETVQCRTETHDHPQAAVDHVIYVSEVYNIQPDVVGRGIVVIYAVCADDALVYIQAFDLLKRTFTLVHICT